jgi:hypothetical protein
MADPLPQWARGYDAEIQKSINEARKLASDLEECLKRLDKLSEGLTGLIQ